MDVTWVRLPLSVSFIISLMNFLRSILPSGLSLPWKQDWTHLLYHLPYQILEHYWHPAHTHQRFVLHWLRSGKQRKWCRKKGKDYILAHKGSGWKLRDGITKRPITAIKGWCHALHPGWAWTCRASSEEPLLEVRSPGLVFQKLNIITRLNDTTISQCPNTYDASWHLL